jgi:hypothetical protein
VFTYNGFCLATFSVLILCHKSTQLLPTEEIYFGRKMSISIAFASSSDGLQHHSTHLLAASKQASSLWVGLITTEPPEIFPVGGLVTLWEHVVYWESET